MGNRSSAVVPTVTGRVGGLLVLAVATLLAGRSATAQAGTDRLAGALVLSGGMRFDVPAVSDHPRTSRIGAVAAARVYRPAGGPLPTAEFARFTSSSTRLSPDGRTRPVYERRPIWLVRYSEVRVRRASAIPPRRGGATPTVPTVLVDVVVVVDDATSQVLLRSEMRASPPPGRAVYL